MTGRTRRAHLYALGFGLAWPLGASDGDGGWKCKNENIFWIFFSLFIHYFFELQPVFKVKGAIFIKTKGTVIAIN